MKARNCELPEGYRLLGPVGRTYHIAWSAGPPATLCGATAWCLSLDTVAREDTEEDAVVCPRCLRSMLRYQRQHDAHTKQGFELPWFVVRGSEVMARTRYASDAARLLVEDWRIVNDGTVVWREGHELFEGAGAWDDCAAVCHERMEGKWNR